MCVDVHQSVASKSLQFLAELSRHNYVTPTSYLELLGTFGKLLKMKMNEISTHRNRTKTGLDKVCTPIVIIVFCSTVSLACTLLSVYLCLQLLNTSEEVAKLQVELEEMQPLLEQAQVRPLHVFGQRIQCRLYM